MNKVSTCTLLVACWITCSDSRAFAQALPMAEKDTDLSLTNGDRTPSVPDGSVAMSSTAPLIFQSKIGGGAEGSITKNGDGSFTVFGGGIDIWDASDAFTFHYLSTSGDFDVKVRVESFEPASRWAKAGLMARESLAPDS